MKKRLISLAFIVTLVTCLTSCQKNMAPEKQTDPIKQSRIWFNRQFDASLAVKDNQLTGGDKYPIWQMAKQYAYNGLSIVEVPLVFKNRPIYGVKESGNNFSLPANASVSKLMIARTGAGAYQAAIVDMVADKAFYNTGGEVSQLSLNNMPQSFNGYLLSRTWYGEPQVGYRLEGGRIKQKIKPRKAPTPSLSTDDTEMKDAIAGGGIPFGILCEGCDFYMNAGDVASYPICATVAMACGQEMWDTDYTDPCSIEMGNIFGCPCENGVINYDNCGFGSGGGTTVVPDGYTPEFYSFMAGLDAWDDLNNLNNSLAHVNYATENLRQHGRTRGWDIGVSEVQFNRKVGKAFEATALAFFDLPGKCMPELAPERGIKNAANGGTPNEVVPDALTPAVYWKPSNSPSVPATMEWLYDHICTEVKAVNGTIHLSDNRWQIYGELEVLTRSAGTLNPSPRKRPLLFFITTSNTEIGDDIINEAYRRGIRVWQSKATYDPNNCCDLSFTTPKMLNFTPNPGFDEAPRSYLGALFFGGPKMLESNPSADCDLIDPEEVQ